VFFYVFGLDWMGLNGDMSSRRRRLFFVVLFHCFGFGLGLVNDEYGWIDV
jgi:hypothetical protein